MGVEQLETEVARLSSADLKKFSKWFLEFHADAWDRQMEADIAAGKLDHLAKKADEDFEAGRCTPL